LSVNITLTQKRLNIFFCTVHSTAYQLLQTWWSSRSNAFAQRWQNERTWNY